MKIINNKQLTSLLIVTFFTFMALLLPPASAAIFQCTYEDWEGTVKPCNTREAGTLNWPYKVIDDVTYWTITRKGEWINLPKHDAIKYDFSNPQKISWVVTVEANNQWNSISTANQTHRTATIAIEGSPNLVEFLFDEQHRILNSTGDVQDISSGFTTEGNDLIFVFEKDFINDISHPVTIPFDSYLVNVAEGWNGTFTQTNLDINESVIIDQRSTLYQDATLYIKFDEFNATHIKNENTSIGDCEIFTASSQETGWINNSWEFDPPDNKGIFCRNLDEAYTPYITVGGWLKTNSTSNFQMVISDAAWTTTVNKGFELIYIGGTSYQFSAGNGTVSETSTIATPIQKWVHVVGRYNGSCTAIFIDGIEQDADCAISGPITPGTRGWNIGNTANIREFDGWQDEIFFFNRSLSDAEIYNIAQNPWHPSGNFTTDVRTAPAGQIANNITASFTLDGASSVNMYLNSSQDSWATENIAHLCTGCTSGTNYTTSKSGQDYKVIVELINGSTPHIHYIIVDEGVDDTPPNITAMFPANLTSLETVTLQQNINFTVTCFDNVDCQNATLELYYINGTPLNFTVTDNADDWVLLVGTGFSGTLADTEQSDNIRLDIQEESTNDGCLEAIFNFTGLKGAVDSGIIVVEGFYNGGAGHQVELSWKNFTSGEWINFANATKETSDQLYTTGTIPTIDAIDDFKNASILMNHTAGICISGHHFFIDELIATSLAGDLTSVNVTSGGTAGIQVEIPIGEYKYTFLAFDTSGNNAYFSLGNYSFNITARIPNAVTIFLPQNKTYNLEVNIPFRVTSNEDDISSWWYSLNGGDNVSFVPNITLFNVANGNYLLEVYINLTNGENSSAAQEWFTIDYGATIELDGEGMIWQLYILVLGVGLVLMFIALLTARNPATGAIIPVLSGLFLFAAAFYSYDITQAVGGGITYTYIYPPLGMLWGSLGLLMFGMALWRSTQDIPKMQGG